MIHRRTSSFRIRISHSRNGYRTPHPPYRRNRYLRSTLRSRSAGAGHTLTLYLPPSQAPATLSSTPGITIIKGELSDKDSREQLSAEQIPSSLSLVLCLDIVMEGYGPKPSFPLLFGSQANFVSSQSPQQPPSEPSTLSYHPQPEPSSSAPLPIPLCMRPFV
jgi:hypothetical protein